jgi:hypothetical protein
MHDRSPGTVIVPLQRPCSIRSVSCGGAGWLIHVNPVPGVEAIRRRRLMLVPASILVMTGIVLVVFVS